MADNAERWQIMACTSRPFTVFTHIQQTSVTNLKHKMLHNRFFINHIQKLIITHSNTRCMRLVTYRYHENNGHTAQIANCDYLPFWSLSLSWPIRRVPWVFERTSPMIVSASSSFMEERYCFIRSYFSQGFSTAFAFLATRGGTSNGSTPCRFMRSQRSSHGRGFSLTCTQAEEHVWAVHFDHGWDWINGSCWIPDATCYNSISEWNKLLVHKLWFWAWIIYLPRTHYKWDWDWFTTNDWVKKEKKTKA